MPHITVCNQGTNTAFGSDIVVYASADPTIEPGPGSTDVDIGFASVPPLQAGECRAVLANLATPPGPQGEYFLGVVADLGNQVSELLEDNNTTVVGPFGFGFGPDLAVTQVNLPASADQPFTANVTVCNQGTAAASAHDLTLYASLDATIETPAVVPGTEDTFLGNAPVAGLNAGECSTVDVAASAPPSTGAFFVGAIVDEINAVIELLEGNNTTVAGPIGLGTGSDLVVRTLVVPTVLNGPGQTADVTVCNDGTAPSTPTDVLLSASVDQVITLPPALTDPQIGFAPVPALNPGECSTESPVVIEPAFSVPVGQAFVGATVDPSNFDSELVEVNNQRLVGPIGVGAGVELRVAAVSGPAFVGPGQEISVDVQVCNDGDQLSPPTDVALFASPDQVLDVRGLDPFIGTASTPAVPAAGCVDLVAPTFGFAGLVEGIWYLAAEVDPNQAVVELLEGNNGFVGSPVEVAVVFCGNGVVDPGEECDDGNFASGDGCNASCVAEFCGDGIVNNGGAEVCDDGNTTPYDGCSATCQPQGQLIGEVIQLSSDQTAGTWYPASFIASFTQPVVVGHTLSFAGGDPTHLRVRNVTSGGFEWQMEEWTYLDGNHTKETLPFLAVESGNHTLEDGTRIEAATVSVTDGWTSVTFSTPFAAAPVLLTGVMSANDTTAVVVRTRNVTAQGFDVRLQEEEGQDGTHAAETVAFAAMEAGVGGSAGIVFEARRTPDAVRHPWYRIDFSAPFSLAPVFLGNIDRFDGPDTAGLRYRNLLADRVEVKVEEEKSANSETNHTTETVSWAAWSAPGVLLTAP